MLKFSKPNLEVDHVAWLDSTKCRAIYSFWLFAWLLTQQGQFINVRSYSIDKQFVKIGDKKWKSDRE